MIALRDQPRNPRPNLFLFPCLLLFAAAAAVTTTTPANAQTCQTAADMDAPSLTALETTANRYFEMAVHGDAPALKQNAIPSVAASFAGIESAVREDQRAFTDAKAIPARLSCSMPRGLRPCPTPNSSAESSAKTAKQKTAPFSSSTICPRANTESSFST